MIIFFCGGFWDSTVGDNKAKVVIRWTKEEVVSKQQKAQTWKMGKSLTS